MASLQEAAEILAHDLANRQGKGIDLPLPNAERIAHHLRMAETGSQEERECNLAVADYFDPPKPKPRPEVKWGRERRRRIAAAMFSKENYMSRRMDVITYVRREKFAHGMADFFDRVATEQDMRHVERLLRL